MGRAAADSYEAPGDDTELREELALANARLEEYSMQLEGVQQELQQQQQQAAERVRTPRLV